MNEQVPAGGSGVRGCLRDRMVRESVVYHRNGSGWREWLKICDAEKGSNLDVLQALNRAETHADEIAKSDITNAGAQRGLYITTMVHTRMIHH